MTKRYVSRALTVAALTCGVAATAVVARAHDQDKDKHDPYILKTSPKATHEHVSHTTPKQQHEKHSKYVTLVGCFIRTTDSDGDHATYVLADAAPGPATTVADQNCAASGTGQLLKLKDADDVGLTQLASGRWIEIYGELGRPRDADDMRKFELKSFREVPQTPRVAILIPRAPAPVVETPPAQEQAVTESPKPMATTGETPMEKKLPKTASELPLVALLGLFAISGGLALSALNRGRVFGRE
jgi:membrane anchored protein